MPLKLSVGLSRKIGLPHYGSLGASCQVEVELDGGLLREDPDRFHRHVKNAFVACRQAVQEELSRRNPVRHAVAQDEVMSQAPPFENAPNGDCSYPGAQHTTNGHRGELTSELPDTEPATYERATAKQLEFVRRLAGQIRGLGLRRLETTCAQWCEKPLAALNEREASQLIDKLKAVKSGEVSLEELLGLGKAV